MVSANWRENCIAKNDIPSQRFFCYFVGWIDLKFIRKFYFIWSAEHKMQAIEAALKDFQLYTVIRFVQRTNEPDYLNFVKEKG